MLPFAWNQRSHRPLRLVSGAGFLPYERMCLMAVKFAGTMNAINRGLDETKPDKGAHMVEDWEAALADLDVTGAKGILRDLGSLQAARKGYAGCRPRPRAAAPPGSRDDEDRRQGGQVAGQAEGTRRGIDRGGRGSARRG